MLSFVNKIPNFLTMLRIVLLPFICIFIYINNSISNCIAIVLIFIACISDFFDGKIARKYNICSSFGRCMDPIADKLLVSLLIIMLVYLKKAWIFPCIIILFREFLISGIREFVSREKQISIPVSKLAKLKTATQMISLFVLMLVAKDGIFNIIGNLLLILSAILSVISCYQYLKSVKNIILQN